VGEIFESASIETIKEAAERRRGRFSGPILDRFLRSDLKCAKLRREKVAPNKKAISIYYTLKSYLRNHPDLPIDVFLVKSESYLVRTDK